MHLPVMHLPVMLLTQISLSSDARFMEEKLRQKDTMIEKLRLKNSTIKAQISKMEHMLAHKEELGEVLHLVDFDQLKIENQQYLEKIEERNQDLLRLKLSTSRTVQVNPC